MTAVVDLGCYTHPRYPEDESTWKLIGRFEPKLYVGFDPHPDVVPVGDWPSRVHVGSTAVIVRRAAAWTHDGAIAYDPRHDRPLAAAVGSGPLIVECFDLAAWLECVADWRPGAIILKVDIEGAEYPLLEHLHVTGADALVTLALIEWHYPPIGPPDWERKRDDLLARLRCPAQEW